MLQKSPPMVKKGPPLEGKNVAKDPHGEKSPHPMRGKHSKKDPPMVKKALPPPRGEKHNMEQK